MVAVCDGDVRIHRCSQCSVEFASYLASRRADRDHFAGLDADMYAQSVKATREASYDELLERVSAFVASGRWLDVGCSYGWLLRRAKTAGFDVFGVEPSPEAAEQSRAAGLDVTTGMYPDVVGAGAPYSVVSFMDVLEHLPDPVRVLESTASQLTPDGVVVVQVPDQACLLYFAGRFLCRWSGGRMDFALKRLWLTELDFPHRFYFNLQSLTLAFSRAGFEIVDWHRAPIGAPGQARARVGYMNSQRGVSSLLVAAGVAGINAVDSLCEHGGLLVAIARPRRSH